MKSIVPYQKEIKFKSKIAEICSISLEHDLNIKENDIEGNFIVSGEYKSHELSVNKEPFNYKLPFSIEITDNIIKESIDFEINDFTYEIISDDTLKVDIEFTVLATENEKVEQREEEIREINEMFLEPDLLTETSLQEPEILKEVMKEEDDPAAKEEEEVLPVTTEEEEVNDSVERLDEMSEDLIINSASTKNDEYATYHIHIVKSGDTVETICSLYNVDVNTIKEYNNMENINIGEKIIIPEIDE